MMSWNLVWTTHNRDILCIRFHSTDEMSKTSKHSVNIRCVYKYSIWNVHVTCYPRDHLLSPLWHSEKSCAFLFVLHLSQSFRSVDQNWCYTIIKNKEGHSKLAGILILNPMKITVNFTVDQCFVVVVFFCMASIRSKIC